MNVNELIWIVLYMAQNVRPPSIPWTHRRFIAMIHTSLRDMILTLDPKLSTCTYTFVISPDQTSYTILYVTHSFHTSGFLWNDPYISIPYPFFWVIPKISQNIIVLFYIILNYIVLNCRVISVALSPCAHGQGGNSPWSPDLGRGWLCHSAAGCIAWTDDIAQGQASSEWTSGECVSATPGRRPNGWWIGWWNSEILLIS